MSLLLLYEDSSGRPRARALRGTIAVGRNPESTGIVLEHDSVAGQHAIVDAGAAPPLVSTVSPEAALFVNGCLVKRSPLRHGDVVRFGEIEAIVAEGGRWAEAAGLRRHPVPGTPATGSRAPSKAVEETPGAPFPFLRVAAVTVLLFSGAFGIYFAWNVKWRAKLDEKDVGVERRAQAIRALFAPTPTAAPTAVPASTAAPAQNTPTPSENPLTAALRSVVSITGDVRIEGQRGTILGSGFFVSETGLILTNAHVMDHEGRYSAKTHDGRYLDLMDRERDRKLDLGLLAAMGKGPFPALPFGHAKDMSVGDQVFALGSPLSPELGFSVTRGIVSSPLRVFQGFEGRSFLQHDAAINPGNSGGPLVDSAGRLVGVNTWKIVGEGTQGLGFAIPVEVVEGVLRDWKVRP